MTNRTINSGTPDSFSYVGNEIRTINGNSLGYDKNGNLTTGRKDVRSVLYMAALTARRCNPVIRRFAQRLEDEGKVFKVVITACMRKLLIILNTMIRNQTLWTEEIILKNP